MNSKNQRVIGISEESYDWLVKNKKETGSPISFQVNKLIEQARIAEGQDRAEENNEEF